jgi:hypothetical protein
MYLLSTKEQIPSIIDKITFFLQMAFQIPSIKFSLARAVVKGRALINSLVDCFSEEPDCRGANFRHWMPKARTYQ